MSGKGRHWALLARRGPPVLVCGLQDVSCWSTVLASGWLRSLPPPTKADSGPRIRVRAFSWAVPGM